MKIGLVIYGSLDTLSGGYFYDRQMVKYLRENGDEVRIYSLPWRNYPAHLTDNIQFRLPKGLDVLIQDELNHPSLLGANRGRHAYPVISLVHHLRCSEKRAGWLNWFYRTIERSYLRSVDGFIFNSKTTEKAVQTVASVTRPSIVAYPPTDRFGLALPADVVSERAKHKGALRVVFLGNVIPRKGLTTLLEAARLCKAELRVDIIGSQATDPRYSENVRRLARRLPPGRITFHGSLAHQEIAVLFKSAHVLAVPSSYEGFGIVYLEGMGFGLPAIGTTAGAAGEVITHGRDGFLVDPDDAGALAGFLDQLAGDRGLLNEMSLQALERFGRQPAWQQTAGEIRSYLQKMV